MTDDISIRKQAIQSETLHRDGERKIDSPIRKIAATAVFENPFAGEWADDISRLTEWGERLGGELGREAVSNLGTPVESYGKGGIIGSEGELEHMAAILHPKLGGPFRQAVGGGDAIIPSAKKYGTPGTTLNVPTYYKDDAYVRSHFGAMGVRVGDAPRPDELLLALVVANGGRPHPHTGGKTISEVED